MAVTVVDHDIDERAEIIAALIEHNRTAMRLPAHFVDRKAAIHAQINALLTMLEATP